MTDTHNMTLKNLEDYYDPQLRESSLVTVPNGLLRELKEARKHSRIDTDSDFSTPHGEEPRDLEIPE